MFVVNCNKELSSAKPNLHTSKLIRHTHIIMPGSTAKHSCVNITEYSSSKVYSNTIYFERDKVFRRQIHYANENLCLHRYSSGQTFRQIGFILHGILIYLNVFPF